MNEKTQLEFIPFHAINEFMRNDFRLNVIRTTLLSLNQLDRQFSAPIDRLTRKHVTVAGFRNSVKAPATIKAVAMVKAFENQPKMVGAILNAWAESKTELRQLIYDLLVERGWKVLPIEADRTRLPGFMARWPAEDDYELLYQAFTDSHPEMEASIDEISLMVVWISGRLPIDKVSKDELDMPELPLSSETTDQE
ncbi:MAG: hypothetical protein MUO62_09020 [Anaerolineales bacterium]|nr:hypothetical protein [Anaerolineales bacterium]